MKKTKSKNFKPKLPSMKIDLNPKTSLSRYDSIGALILGQVGGGTDGEQDDLAVATAGLINEVLSKDLLLPTSPLSPFASKPVSLDGSKNFRKKRLKPFAQWMKQAVKESGIDQEGVGIVKFLALYSKRWAEMAANDPYHPDRDASAYVGEYLHKLFNRIADDRYDNEFSRAVIKKYGKRKMVFTPHKSGGSIMSWTYGGKENPEAEAAMDVANQRANMQYTLDLIRAFGLLAQDYKYWWV